MGVLGEGSDFFEFVEEPEVVLSDFHVLLVVAVGEGPAFGGTDVFLVLGTGGVEGELVAAVLAYPFELAKVDVVGPGSGRGTSSAETAMSLRELACCSSSEISYIAAYKPNEPNQNYSAPSALSDLV